MSNSLHNKVFDFCESYRTAHSDLLYWLRERNTKNRLKEGTWFQENKEYAFVGLYNREAGNLSTRSFGLVFSEEADNILCHVEITFKNEKDDNVISFYKEAIGLVGDFKEDSPASFKRPLPGINGFSAAKVFLDKYKGKLDGLVKTNKIEHLFITQNKFLDKLERILQYRSQPQPSSDIKYIIANLSWNSNDWQGESQDKSGHSRVSEGNTPHESWNFDFNNARNKHNEIKGFCQFKNEPKVEGNNNLLIFYSNNQIVGFYGKAEIMSSAVKINKKESYNIIGYRPLCVLLKNKITSVKEKSYLETKQRIGRIRFSYLQNKNNIKAILNEALLLNPDATNGLNAISDWLHLCKPPVPIYWILQANPVKVNRIVDALNARQLQSWMVNQYKKDIHIGDKIILCVSGNTAGIYALAMLPRRYIRQWLKKKNINVSSINQKSRKVLE